MCLSVFGLAASLRPIFSDGPLLILAPLFGRVLVFNDALCGIRGHDYSGLIVSDQMGSMLRYYGDIRLELRVLHAFGIRDTVRFAIRSCGS